MVAFGWFYGPARYVMLANQDVSLFLTTPEYFHSFVQRPGGFLQYTGDFLSQFLMLSGRFSGKWWRLLIVVPLLYLVSDRYMLTATEEPVRMKGLDLEASYRIRELNLLPGSHPVTGQEKTYTGEYLMKVGINPGLSRRRTSVVLEITRTMP